jgi:tetratricopeptide (TPR) repeat protein
VPIDHQTPSKDASHRRPAGGTAWAYRLCLAVAVPILFLVALEASLRLAGYGKPATFLIPDEVPGYYRTNPDFVSLFLPGNFDLRPLNLRIARHKPPNTLRIVVLGESAAQGVPVPSFAFAAQLRAQLRHRFPGRDFEVIDTGIVAINSHVLYQIAREMAGFEPDLFVVYAGNNEVVGPYGPGCAYLSQMPPLWVIRASVLVRSTRTGQVLGSLAARLSSSRQRRAEWGGMSMFVNNAVLADDPRIYPVYENFAENLRGIVAAASGAGAKTLLCTVVANLKDCPPFLSRHGAWLSKPELAAWQGPYERGRLAWLLGDNREARAELSEALRIDPEFADTSFLLGSLDLQQGEVASARQHFLSALHWDALRFRPDAPINQAIREVARGAGPGTSLLDSAAELGSDPASAGGISGREILFEHVHFDWDGNYRLARLMARSAAAALFGQDPGDAGWLDRGGCADALAYTPHERLPMLLRIDVLVRKPPFTNQLTHVGDEARLAREIEGATRDRGDPAKLEAAAVVATRAVAGDPGNPALAGILEGIDLDRGDADGALLQAKRAAELLPPDFALSADLASVLMKLGRFDEAGSILMRASSGADLDLMLPVLDQFWSRTKRLQEGIAFVDRMLAGRPNDLRLRVIRAGLLAASGDRVAAEQGYRSVLAGDPSSEDAQEGLVALLQEQGRADEAAGASASAAPFQPRNQGNSLRAAKYCEARGDMEGLVRNLSAAEQSGPVNATFELTLALKFYQLRRLDDMMEHLAVARRLSTNEGDAAVTDSIDSLIGRMRIEWELAAKAARP